MSGERFYCALAVGLGGGALFALIEQLMETLW
jgi:hypothetical protein